jgi:hypothetical protein
MKPVPVLDLDRPRAKKISRGSSFLRLTGGGSIVHYWRVSDDFALPPRTLSPAELAAADEPTTRERDNRSTPPSRRPGPQSV